MTPELLHRLQLGVLSHFAGYPSYALPWNSTPKSSAVNRKTQYNR